MIMDMKNGIKPGLLVACLIYLSACSIGGSGGDKAEPVTFSATANPEEGGSVSVILGSGNLMTGDSVKVKANPYNGYAFTGWSGDLTASENPFAFVIENDTELSGNFEATSSEYQVEMSVADTTDTLNVLRFGQLSSATDGIDAEDFEAPPPPPADELHAYFQNDKDLFWDYRSTTAGNLTWTLQLQPGATDSLFLSWSSRFEGLHGSVTLRNEDSSIELDMTATDELAIAKGEVDHLLIEYQLGNLID